MTKRPEHIVYGSKNPGDELTATSKLGQVTPIITPIELPARTMIKLPKKNFHQFSWFGFKPSIQYTHPTRTNQSIISEGIVIKLEAQ